MNWRKIYRIALAVIIGGNLRFNVMSQTPPMPFYSTDSATVVESTNVESKAEVETTTTVEATTAVETTTEVGTTAVAETTKVQTTMEVETTTAKTSRSTKNWSGEKLNRRNGTVMGPSGKETYYNLNMYGVIRIMRNSGYSEKKYPYHIREDGVKMLGPYIMCAADLNLRPRGTIIETSLGTAIVCDTGAFAMKNPRQLDIAVDW